MPILVMVAAAAVLSGAYLPADNESRRLQDADPWKTVTFPSLDMLPVTANLYEAVENGPYILLCHQARYSRGEYREIAVELNRLGYNCMAIDQRSGGEVNGVVNETAGRAKEKGLPAGYLDAEQDIVAAVNYLSDKTGQFIILWGSSYSAALALRVGMGNEKVRAVISFSPGEYFDGINIAGEIGGKETPLFVTSSADEAAAVTELVREVRPELVHQFIPAGNGFHGSRALWRKNKGNEEYWEALKQFLGVLE